jgi:hypothetical protein
MIEIKKLKHGSIPVTNVADQVTRDILMRMNENVVGLSTQLQELQTAALQMQRDIVGLNAKVYALENP